MKTLYIIYFAIAMTLAAGCGEAPGAPADSGATLCGGVTYSGDRYYRCAVGCPVGSFVPQPPDVDPALCVASCSGCSS
jgi:hypothetical protein